MQGACDMALLTQATGFLAYVHLYVPEGIIPLPNCDVETVHAAMISQLQGLHFCCCASLFYAERATAVLMMSFPNAEGENAESSRVQSC